MRLNQKNMQAAHFARQIDLDPNYTVKGEARARAWSREMVDPDLNPKDEEETAKLYQLGKKVLSKYTLTYSPRFVRGTVPPPIPSDVVGHIAVDSGHIATAEAVRLAMFRKR